MTFLSFNYLLIFLPIAVGCYYLFRKTPYANVIVLVASYVFYGLTHAWYLIPLVFTSLVDFVVGLLLSRTDRTAYRRALLITSLTANLGLLAFFQIHAVAD